MTLNLENIVKIFSDKQGVFGDISSEIHASVNSIEIEIIFENILVKKLKVGDEFIKNLPTIDQLNECNNPSYTITALNAYKEYSKTLNNINLVQFNASNNTPEYYIQYIKDFCSEIFNNISKINYPLSDIAIIGWHTRSGINRGNHGGLNHLRSLKFGIYVIKMIINSNVMVDSTIYNSIFPNDTFLIMLILSTMFESIMRVDETGSSGCLCKLTKAYFNKLYPRLAFEIYAPDYRSGDQTGSSHHQIASSVLYLILMKHCFKDIDNETDLELVARGVSYHWSLGDNINIMRVDITDINKENNLKFFIYYVMVIAGHYLDHARDSFSEMIRNPDIQQLFKIFEIDELHQIELVKLIMRTLTETELTGYNGDIEAIDDTDMKQYCVKLRERFRHAEFKILSNNFDKAWEKLGIETDLTDLFVAHHNKIKL